MSPAATRPDGRHARKARTRTSIVTALLALLDEGQPNPTAAQIAARADVAVRSIAQHFPTREQLMLALATGHLERQPKAPKAGPRGPLLARLTTFVAARAQELEGSRGMRKAALTAADRSASITSALADIARRRKAALVAALGPELSRRPPWARHAVEALCSGATWDVLRRDQHLSVSAAETVVVQTIRHLLGA